MATEKTFYKKAPTPQNKLPDSFAQYLQQNHGINLNAKPKTITEWWIHFRYNSDQLYTETNRWYEKIRKHVQEAQRELKWANDRLTQMWGLTFEMPFDLSTLHANNWRIPAKAVNTLKKVYEELPTSGDIRARREELDVKERTAWIAELLQTAQELKSTFVVIKDKTFTPYYQENIDKFNESVQKREYASILLMSIAPMWLACPIEKLEEVLSSSNCLSKKECTVEFLTNN